VGDLAAKQAVVSLHDHLDRVLAFLDEVHSLAQGEMVAQLAAARTARREALLVIAIMVSGGLATGLAVGTVLTRSVLRPLRALDEAATRFGAGDLSHRIFPTAQDELGQLGRTFNTMADRLAQSQATLADLSTLDGLTGLYNYREFRRRLSAEVERSWRYGRSFALLILDIDNFKAVNDTHGHLAGDEVLRALATLMRRAVRPNDQVSRYGGEEFAFILPETPAAGALVVGERLRTLIAAQAITLTSGQAVSLTVSIGVADHPDDAQSEDRLIAAADHALYAAKNAGRNRIRRFRES
jgi:diguanylate cyclase (GGDEF)-like protein